VWIEDWGLAWLGEGSWQLRATVDSGAMELQLASGTAAGVLPSPFGSELEPRDATPSNVGTSGLRGYQMPRLTATGTVDTGTGPIPVSGPAWLDHGWGDLGALLGGRQGQLRANQFRVSLDDGAMLDCLELRRVGGGGTPVPSCALTASDGSQRHYQRRALSLLPEPPAWNAPGGTRFPLRWRLRIPPERLELSLTPLVEDQRLRLFDQPIWSGPVIVDGERAGTSVAGRGWMDLSGG
jgi:predicted secreted hydrolase